MAKRVTIRPLVTYPDPRLTKASEAVDAFDADLRALIADLQDTMKDAQGIGITAPHIGVMKRIAIVQLTPDDPLKVYINPKVEWASDTLAPCKEGSVSMQGVVDDISRPASVRVAFQDLDGKEQSEEADGLLAVCLQHEIDQLDGIFWIQKLSRLKKERVVKKYEKLKRAFAAEAAAQAAAAQAEGA